MHFYIKNKTTQTTKGLKEMKQGPEFGHQNPHLKNWAWLDVIVILALGRQRQPDLWDSLASQTILIGTFYASERPYLKNINKQNTNKQNKGLVAIEE